MRTLDDMASFLQVMNAKAYVKYAFQSRQELQELEFSVQGLSAGSDILPHLCQCPD